MTPLVSGRRFSDDQKMGAILLFVFALVAVGLGLLQLRNTIYSPFVIHLGDEGTAPLFTDERTRLQKIDTDHDGLNDYEELEFYGTSPYLPDTDSDGMKDKMEIEQGSDPTCADGASCATAEEQSQKAPDFTVPQIGDTGLGLLGQSVTDASSATGTPFDLEALARDPTALRQLLLQTGKLSAEDLKKIDDATLLAIARDIVKQTATTTQ